MRGVVFETFFEKNFIFNDLPKILQNLPDIAQVDFSIYTSQTLYINS